MREADPLAVFLPYTEAIVNAQPGLAYIHAIEGVAMGPLETPEHLQTTVDTLEPIRKVVDRAGGIKLLVAGGYMPDTALSHAEQTEDMIVFGRYFICMCL
jgi:NADPH2 dehydrogenase